MNKINKTLLISIAAFTFSMPFAMQARADAVEDGVSKILNTIVKKVSSSDKFKDKFCRKADFFSGVYSVRSGSGVACQNKAVAAMAEIVCTEGNLDKYSESHCHKNAVKALGDADPKEVLEGLIKASAGKARDLMCKPGAKEKLPSALAGVAGKACGS